MFFLYFFFQAEDGIRDSSVTGVQTCALPICPARSRSASAVRRDRVPCPCRSASDSAPTCSRQQERAGSRSSSPSSDSREIGRASCRERGEIRVVHASIEEKRRSVGSHERVRN